MYIRQFNTEYVATFKKVFDILACIAAIARHFVATFRNSEMCRRRSVESVTRIVLMPNHSQGIAIAASNMLVILVNSMSPPTNIPTCTCNVKLCRYPHPCCVAPLPITSYRFGLLHPYWSMACLIPNQCMRNFMQNGILNILVRYTWILNVESGNTYPPPMKVATSATTFGPINVECPSITD